MLLGVESWEPGPRRKFIGGFGGLNGMPKLRSNLYQYHYKSPSYTLLLPNSNTIAPPRLLNIPHLLARHFQMHLHSATTTLVHILDLLSLLDIESITLTLAAYPPFGFQRDTRVPTSNRSVHGPTSYVGSGWCLAIKGGLVASGLDNVFPEVASCG